MAEHAQPKGKESVFGAPPGAVPNAAAERRGAERFPCDLQPFWAEWGSGGGESAAARVHNISTTGISLDTPVRIRPGSVLVIKLLSKERGLSRPLLVRVIHSTQKPDGRWLSGGAFVRRLSDKDLQTILSEGAPE
jgi:hypothetical protein